MKYRPSFLLYATAALLFFASFPQVFGPSSQRIQDPIVVENNRNQRVILPLQDQDVAVVSDDSTNAYAFTQQGGRGGQFKKNVTCRLTVIESIHEKTQTTTSQRPMLRDFDRHDDWNVSTTTITHEYGCIPVIDCVETHDLLSIALTNDFIHTYGGNISEGTLLVSIHHETWNMRENNHINVRDTSSMQVINNDVIVPSRLRHLQHFDQSKLKNSVGTKYAYIIRVATTDSSPANTLEELKDGIMSTDTISFKSQFHACSYGQLQWKLAGATNVHVNEPIRNFQRPMDLTLAAMAALQKKLNVNDLTTLADHLLFCLPQGAFDGWIGTAPMNHYVSYLHSKYCLSLSALIHMAGKNMGLLPAGVGEQSYGDGSGYMGYVSKAQKWPRKCFNGLHSWQLDWYRAREVVLYPETIQSTLKIAGVVDYKKTDQTEAVLLNIGYQYYLTYNRAKGMNVATEAMENQLTITEDTPRYSQSRKGLDVGERFVVPNYYQNSRDLVIEVCHRVTTRRDKADYLIISVALDQSFCTCTPQFEECDFNWECCGSNLRCLDRDGRGKKCRNCRKKGQFCKNHGECCGGGRSCKNNTCSY